MRRIIHITLAALVTSVLAAGCNNREIGSAPPNQSKVEFRDIPVYQNRDLDIVFVIDNSISMREEQESLALNFPKFISVLENIQGGMPNVRIGVISTDVGAGPWPATACTAEGDHGSFQFEAACGMDDVFMEDIDDGNGGRLRNYSGELADAFSCVAQLGTTGCGFEQPLESMRKALDPSNAINADFLRPDAYLAIVIVTDEDDCSVADTDMFDSTQTTLDSELGPLSSFRCFEFGVVCDDDNVDPRQYGQRSNCRPRDDSRYMTRVQSYVEFLEDLKGDRSMVMVAGIIGDAGPVAVVEDRMRENTPALAASCTSPAGEAAPAVRLEGFIGAFPARGTVTSICEEDLSSALEIIANRLVELIGNACLAGDMDLEPETPGVQYECQVSDVRYPDTAMQQETVIPSCEQSGGAHPCWRLEPNEQLCSMTETQLELIVERDGDALPGTHVQAHCAVLPDAP